MRVSQKVAPIIGLAAGGLVFLETLLRLRNTAELRAVLLISTIWGLIVWGIMRLTAWVIEETRSHPSSGRRSDGIESR